MSIAVPDRNSCYYCAYRMSCYCAKDPNVIQIVDYFWKCKDFQDIKNFDYKELEKRYKELKASFGK